MNKIEDLKLQQKHLSAGLERLAKNIGCQKDALDAVEKQIAALEAEASKPREYKFRLYGDILYSETSVSGTPITLIEKKPVRVTREKTSLMDKVWCKWSNDDDNVHAWVEALKAIGIDAIAAD